MDFLVRELAMDAFFKWIIQHLRIRAFYGTLPSAMKTQVWIAVAVYVLIAIVCMRSPSRRFALRTSTDIERDAIRANPLGRIVAKFRDTPR